MDFSEIVSHLVEMALPILFGALTWGATKAASWLSAKAKNEYAKGAIGRLNESVVTAVREVEMTVKTEIKDRKADGVLSKQDYEHIKASAVAIAKTYLGAKGVKEIVSVLGIDSALIDKLIGGKVEVAVSEMKAASPK